jgi:SAM-dependent methyltransferase
MKGVAGMLRRLRWRLAKMRLAMPPVHLLPSWGAFKMLLWHSAKPEKLPPNTSPYDALAARWSRYAGRSVPRYGRFLRAAARHYGVPMRAVLDLACGTGLIARDVAQAVNSVVGLDISDAMIRQARQETSNGRIRYVTGDVRRFDLGTTFDAAVCGSDSLNYVTSLDELTDVFRCVHQHLNAGGLFVFDVLDDRALRRISGKKVYARIDGTALEIYFMYDARRRVCDDRVVLGDIIEEHRRMPLERAEIFRCAEQAGLQVADWFSFGRPFYVLRRPVGG